MKYTFPHITHIDQVLAVVEGRKEFVVAERNGYTVINYLVQTPDTFPPVETEAEALLRECRGITFCGKTGRVVARKFHKFFNVNEREETQVHHLDLSEPHVILEKLDGSMITPYVDRDGYHVHWHTKMGGTEVASMVNDFIADHPNYDNFAVEMDSQNRTPIFEFCSRQMRIVVDYPVERLVLLAVRDNVTGEYASYADLKYMAEMFDLDLVREYEGTAESMMQLVETVRGQETGEGWVLRFADGHMVKIKSDLYVRIHKTKDLIRYERNLVDLILSESLDDTKGFLDTEDHRRVVEYETDFWREVDRVSTAIDTIYRSARKTGDRKEFALASKYFKPVVRGIVFRMWDGADARDCVLDSLRKALSTNTKFEDVKTQLGMAQEWEIKFLAGD